MAIDLGARCWCQPLGYTVVMRATSEIMNRSPAPANALAAFAMVVAMAIGPLAPASADVFPGLPDVLVCSVDDPIDVQPWDKFVFYVSARLEDGSVLYKSLTSNPVLVTVTEDGRVNAKNLADCDGKTVAELRAEGRAFDFSGK